MDAKYEVFRDMWSKAYGLYNRSTHGMRFGQTWYLFALPSPEMKKLDEETNLFYLEGLRGVEVLDAYYNYKEVGNGGA